MTGSHRTRGVAARGVTATFAFLALTSVACAQEAPGEVSADAAIGGYGLLRTDLDNGGDVEVGSGSHAARSGPRSTRSGRVN